MLSLSVTNCCLRDRKSSDRNSPRRAQSAQVSYRSMDFLSYESLNTYFRQSTQGQLRKGGFDHWTCEIHVRQEMLLDISLKAYRSADSLVTSHHQATSMFILGRSLVSEAKKVIRANVSDHRRQGSVALVEITRKWVKTYSRHGCAQCKD